MGMKLISEDARDIRYLVEESPDKRKSFVIEGIFMQQELQNKNRRLYPKEILEREVERYNREYVAQNRAFGELGHPAGPAINLPLVSHMITSLVQEGNDFIGRAKVLDSLPNGRIVHGLLEAGGRLGVSSRGIGSLAEDSKRGCSVVQDDYRLATGADVVADPSAPGAFVQGVMEGREWVWDNGVLKESVVAGYQSSIRGASRADLDAVGVRAFTDFLARISGRKV